MARNLKYFPHIVENEGGVSNARQIANCWHGWSELHIYETAWGLDVKKTVNCHVNQNCEMPRDFSWFQENKERRLICIWLIK